MAENGTTRTRKWELGTRNSRADPRAAVPRSAFCLRLSSAFDLADRDPRLPALALARGREHGGPGLEGADPGPLAAREVDARDARIADGPRDGPTVEWMARRVSECGTEGCTIAHHQRIGRRRTGDRSHQRRRGHDQSSRAAPARAA